MSNDTESKADLEAAYQALGEKLRDMTTPDQEVTLSTESESEPKSGLTAACIALGQKLKDDARAANLSVVACLAAFEPCGEGESRAHITTLLCAKSYPECGLKADDVIFLAIEELIKSFDAHADHAASEPPEGPQEAENEAPSPDG